MSLADIKGKLAAERVHVLCNGEELTTEPSLHIELTLSEAELLLEVIDRMACKMAVQSVLHSVFAEGGAA